MSRGINATVERALKNGERMIVETLYFIPDFLPALSNPGVLPFYIQVSDPKRYEQMVLERKDYTHPGQPGDRLLPHLDAYRFMAEYSIEACKKKGIKVFDNTNYKDTLTEISKFVESKWHS
ncbi:MAG: hypothetical protein KGH72_02515 [Candidatus Micrarchaeota archaeon]|nr:hypothetical protein [Candidatus Micrarchaeota archaeon]